MAVPLLAVGAKSSVGWIGRPFPGFFVLGSALVPAVGRADWTGREAGVPYRALVVSAGGQPVDGGADVYTAVAGQPVGTTIAYRLEQDGRRFEVRVRTARFTLGDYALTVGLLFAFGAVVLLGGIGVALVRPNYHAVPAFLAQTASTGLFALTAPLLYDPAWWMLSPAHYVAQAVLPAALIHLSARFPVPCRVPVRRVAVTAYALAAVLASFLLLTQYARPPHPLPVRIAFAWSAMAALVCGGMLLWARASAPDPLIRRQLRALLPAVALGLGVAAFGFVSNLRSGGGVPLNLLALTGLVGYLSVGFAIARHQLFAIDRMLRQTLIYGVLTAGITVAYGAAVLLVSLPDSQLLIGRATVFHVAFVIAVAALFEPARARLQRTVDRIFWRERVDYRGTVQEVSAALATLRDLDAIVERLGRTLCHGLQLRGFMAVLWSGDETRVWQWRAAADDRIEEVHGQRHDALRQALAGCPGGVWRVPGPPEGDEPVAFVPLVIAGQVIGAFGLGRRRSGRGFSIEDLQLIGTLAAQSAIALENARSYHALALIAGQLEEKVRQRTGELEASNQELAAAYRELELAQAQLVQSEKMASLGLLVAGVAHEINNPVSFIVGNIDPLRQSLIELAGRARAAGDTGLEEALGRMRRAFEVIARGAERTAGVVNDLRTFSRLGEAQPRPVDLHEGIEVSLRLLRPRWADRITIHRAFAELPPVEAVPGQLNQVLMNLLANACDAIPDRGTVWIGTGVAGPDVFVTIRDDGVGIAPGDLDRVFDPFFSTKSPGKGTGLGLSISHGIVAQHGGTLRLTSTPGEGTTFTLRLPSRARRATT